MGRSAVPAGSASSSGSAGPITAPGGSGSEPYGDTHCEDRYTHYTHYTHGHGAAVLSPHSRRRASDSAAYLLPHLRAGMDPARCRLRAGNRYRGPGRTGPGRSGGADWRGRSLPFDDDTFDAAHTHQVLQHLGDPVGPD